MTVTLDLLFPHLDELIQTPADVQRLNEAILHLAVQGKLVPQDPQDEPAGELLKRIAAQRRRLVEDKKLQDNQPLPQIRDNEKPFALPLEWAWVRFGEAVFNRDSERIPLSRAEREHRQGEYDYYGASGVIDSIDEYLFDKPLLLIGEDGANLLLRSKQIAFIARGKYWVNNHAHVLDSLNEDILQYLTVYINAIDLSPYVTGTAQPKMNQAKMNSIVVALPPLAEQKRIVAKVDELFAQTRALEAKLRRAQAAIVVVNRAVLHHLHHAADNATFQHAAQILGDHFDLLYTDPRPVTDLRQTILQLAVQGKLVPQDPHDEPAGALLKRIAVEKARLVVEGKIGKEKPLPPIDEDEMPFALPMGWEWARFTNVANIATNSTDPTLYPHLPHVAPDNIEKFSGKLLEYRTVIEDGVTSIKHRFYPGQILYSKIRPNLSKVVIVDFEGLCSADMYPIDAYINARYLLTYMLSRTFIEMATKTDTRVAMPKINQDMLSKIVVAVPPLAEQKRIVAKVDELLARCAALERKLGQAQVAGRQLTAAVLQGVVG